MQRSSAMQTPELVWRVIYRAVLAVAQPLVRTRLWWRGRREPGYRERVSERFGAVPEGIPRRPLWIHAVSAGETIAAVPLIERLLQRFPSVPVLVTTMTPTGSGEVKRRLGNRVSHCYAPYDFPRAVRAFQARVQPRALVLVETELWPNMVGEAVAAKVPVILVNGRMSERSARGYARIGALTRSLLQGFALIVCQSEAHRDRFIALGARPERVRALGSVKYDLTLSTTIRDAARQLRARLGLMRRPVWIAASTHPGEDEIIVRAFVTLRQRVPDACLVLVPRHPVRAPQLERMVADAGLRASMHSRLESAAGGVVVGDVLIGDVMGSLLTLYGVADVAFVGGSLVPVGGHNPIEAAVWGIPVVMGPFDFNFADVLADFRAAGAVIGANDAASLAQTLADLVATPDVAKDIGARGAELVSRRAGALERTLAALDEVLSLVAD